MKSKRQLFVLVILMLGIPVVFGWFSFFSGRLFRTHAQNAGNREAMLRIREEIPIGTSKADVHRAFARFRTPELQLVEDSPLQLRFEMPPESSEQAWKLLVDLQDGRVRCLRFRTGDGLPPRDAPADLP